MLFLSKNSVLMHSLNCFSDQTLKGWSQMSQIIFFYDMWMEVLVVTLSLPRRHFSCFVVNYSKKISLSNSKWIDGNNWLKKSWNYLRIRRKWKSKTWERNESWTGILNQFRSTSITHAHLESSWLNLCYNFKCLKAQF